MQEFIASSKVPARYIREERMGHPVAMNTGISAARGDIIAHTDDDALPCSDWLVRLDEAFSTHDAGIVFGPVRPAWESGPPRWFSARFMSNFALLDYGEVPFLVDDEHHPFYGVNHACRKSVYCELGCFREDLGPFGRKSRAGEDSDFFLRALEEGVRIAYQPSCGGGAHHSGFACHKSRSPPRIWQSRESQYWELHDRYARIPWMLGLPRWHFRDAMMNAYSYAKSICRRNPSETFFYELRLRRFLMLFSQASLHGFGIKTPMCDLGRTSVSQGRSRSQKPRTRIFLLESEATYWRFSIDREPGESTSADTALSGCYDNLTGRFVLRVPLPRFDLSATQWNLQRGQADAVPVREDESHMAAFQWPRHSFVPSHEGAGSRRP